MWENIDQPQTLIQMLLSHLYVLYAFVFRVVARICQQCPDTLFLYCTSDVYPPPLLHYLWCSLYSTKFSPSLLIMKVSSFDWPYLTQLHLPQLHKPYFFSAFHNLPLVGSQAMLWFWTISSAISSGLILTHCIPVTNLPLSLPASLPSDGRMIGHLLYPMNFKPLNHQWLSSYIILWASYTTCQLHHLPLTWLRLLSPWFHSYSDSASRMWQ